MLININEQSNSCQIAFCSNIGVVGKSSNEKDDPIWEGHKMMKKAIIYCRSATIDQQSIAELSRQQENCLAYAKAHNYEVIESV